MPLATTEAISTAIAGASAPVTFNDQPISRYGIIPIPDGTTSRTLTAADNGQVIVFTSNSAVTLTFTTSLPTGFNCMVIQRGSGQFTWGGSGVNFLLDPDQTGHTKSKGVNSRVSFSYSGTANTYDVIGSTA